MLPHLKFARISAVFGEFGQQGYGYTIPDLRNEVAEILGMTRGYRAVILGAGNLGRALIKNFHFKESGFDLLAAFDTDPNIVGTLLTALQSTLSPNWFFCGRK